MKKKIYVVRHCEAQGQSRAARLTEKGHQQAINLATFFSEFKIDQIISSPFRRAIQSIDPIGKEKNIKIDIDERLSERILSTSNLSDWLEKLEATFDNPELTFEGGESSKEAMNRIINVVDDILQSELENTMIVTHGNVMALLLHHYNSHFGFEDWKNLSNPDVFMLTCSAEEVYVERLWQEELRED